MLEIASLSNSSVRVCSSSESESLEVSLEVSLESSWYWADSVCGDESAVGAVI